MVKKLLSETNEWSVSRRNVVATVAVLTVVLGLGTVWVLRARQAAERARCGANLMQLGAALASYHDGKKVFPTDDDYKGKTTGPCIPFYADILPFVGEVQQMKTWRDAPRAVPVFLCPSRRTTVVGPKADYAGGHSPNFWTGGNNQSILGNWVGPYGQYRASLRLADIQSADGTANTLLLAHKSMDPKDYLRGDSFAGDVSWADTTTYWDHKRCPYGFTKDRNGGNSALSRCANLTESAFLLGSPHSGAMPCLFADGSVRSLGYDIAPDVCVSLWAYNDGVAPVVPGMVP